MNEVGIPGGGITSGPSGQVAVQQTGGVVNPWNGQQSPLQYYLSNGGNPALSQQFLNMLSSMPGDIAGDPAKAFAAWKQGATTPEASGLTYQNGQFVNSQGNPYDRATDPVAQAQNQRSNANFNNMFQSSRQYNSGGRLDINGQPTAVYTNTSGNAGPRTIPLATNTGHPTMTGGNTAAPSPNTTKPATPTDTTPPPGTTVPPPAPTPPPTPTPTLPDQTASVQPYMKQQTLGAGGAAQYTAPASNNNASGFGGGNQGTNASGVNPYTNMANPYRLKAAGGWNVG